eukprot:3032723-Rhodomonas_salina.1
MPAFTIVDCHIGKPAWAASSPTLDAAVDDLRMYADVLQETDVLELFREGQSLTISHWYEFETAAMTDDS